MDEQRISDGIRRVERGVQAGQRVLEDHLQGSTRHTQGLALEAQQILPEQIHPSSPDAVQPHQRSAERAFAAPGRTHHPQAFTGPQVKADAIHCFQPDGRPGHASDRMPTTHRIHGQHRLAVGTFRRLASLPSPCGRHQALANL